MNRLERMLSKHKHSVVDRKLLCYIFPIVYNEHVFLKNKIMHLSLFTDNLKFHN